MKGILQGRHAFAGQRGGGSKREEVGPVPIETENNPPYRKKKYIARFRWGGGGGVEREGEMGVEASSKKRGGFFFGELSRVIKGGRRNARYELLRQGEAALVKRGG